MSRRLGHYILADKIGGGGAGEVYRAEHELFAGLTFAVKILSEAMRSNPEAIIRFRRECGILMQLQNSDNPGSAFIVRIYEPGHEPDGTWYLPMQYIYGESLDRKIARAKDIPLRQKLEWADQILAALEAAHALKVYHRDIKPQNIMVTREGSVKVIDFGIAHEAGSGLTLLGQPGTPSYQSPEQLLGGRVPVDSRTDLFSFGIVLYELLTGSHPFRAGTIHEVNTKIEREDPLPVTELEPSLPPGLGPVLARVLRKNPNERYESAGRLRSALRDAVGSDGPASDAQTLARQQFKKASDKLAVGGEENLRDALVFVNNALLLWPGWADAIELKARIEDKLQQLARVRLATQRAWEHIQGRRYKEACSALRVLREVGAPESQLGRLEEAFRKVWPEPPEEMPLPTEASVAFDPVAGALDNWRRGSREEASARLYSALADSPGNLRIVDAMVSVGLPVPAVSIPGPGADSGVQVAPGDLAAAMDRVAREIEILSHQDDSSDVDGVSLRRHAETWNRVLDRAALHRPLQSREHQLRKRVRSLLTARRAASM